MINIQSDPTIINDTVAFKAKGGKCILNGLNKFFSTNKKYSEKADEFVKTTFSVNLNDAIAKAFCSEDIDIKTFKALVKKAVDNGVMSKEYAKEIIRKRKFNDFIKSPFITKILEKHCNKNV